MGVALRPSERIICVVLSLSGCVFKSYMEAMILSEHVFISSIEIVILFLSQIT